MRLGASVCVVCVRVRGSSRVSGHLPADSIVAVRKEATMNALTVVVLACLALGCSSSFIQTHYTGTFTGAQVAPVPANTANEGAIVCEYKRNLNVRAIRDGKSGS